MTDDADTASGPATFPLLAVVALLAALTACELVVSGMEDAGRAARITALAGLLMAKVGLVLSFFMPGGVPRWMGIVVSFR